MMKKITFIPAQIAFDDKAWAAYNEN